VVTFITTRIGKKKVNAGQHDTPPPISIPQPHKPTLQLLHFRLFHMLGLEFSPPVRVCQLRNAATTLEREAIPAAKIDRTNFLRYDTCHTNIPRNARYIKPGYMEG